MNTFSTTFLLFIKHLFSRAIKNNTTNGKEEKSAPPFKEFALCQLLYVIPFLNKTSLAKSFC